MASGLVAKKIALFEIKPPTVEQQCRLKRKHAIRRKKYRRRDRTLPSSVDDSLLSLRGSEEFLNRFENSPNAPYSTYAVANSFSASCSALLDLIYNSEQPSAPDSSSQHRHCQDKKFLCRTSSLEEAVPARLNIIDIDIEITVEKRTPSPKDLYEPIEFQQESSFEKIKFTATLESNGSRRSSNSDESRGSGINIRTHCPSHGTSRHQHALPTPGTSPSSVPHYYCTSCGTYNTNKDTLKEHIYENFALVPPPRPPKRFFGGSLSSNYNYNYNSSDSNASGPHGLSPAKFPDDVLSAVEPEIKDKDDITKRKGGHEKNVSNNGEEKEPFYEDLYDYCFPPDDDSCSDVIQPIAVTSFVSDADKEEEVEYCDCSTVMAMAIESLNQDQQQETEEYYAEVSKDPPALPVFTRREVDYEDYEPFRTCEDNNATFNTKDEQIVSSKIYSENDITFDNEASHVKLLCETSLIKGDGRDECHRREDKLESPLLASSYNGGIYRNPCSPSPNKNEYLKRRFLERLCSLPYEDIMTDETNKPDVITIDLKKDDKKDDDDLNKPLPDIPTTTSSGSSSSSSSDSFYSEPLYGITNQITNRKSSLKNPGPPVPDTLRRPSLSPNPIASVISCNNIIRNEPVQGPIYQKSKKHAQSSKSMSSSSLYGSTMYGYNGGGAEYADSVAHSLNPNASKSCGESSANFPNDKLPPLPPSKFTSIAKSAGKKLAKKFLGIRKTSKSSLENYDAPSSSASSTNGSLSGCPTSSSRLSNPSCMPNGSGATTPVGNGKGMAPPIPQNQPKKLLSRPNIPPPEPPKSLYGGSSNGSANSYNIQQELPSKIPPQQQQERHADHRDDDDDDDFDDSDFYDSDSELIRNFVSQVQPIYSMEEEPLYQYYAYGISSKPEDDYQPVIPKNLGLTLDMLVPRGGQRTLWCELSEVIASGILSILSDKQKQLQEAIFEILTSEVSYLKSLDVLITVFYKNQELIGVLTEEERSFVFGNIEEVRACAQAFLAELLSKWEESWYIQEIGEIINRNTNSRFSVYKEYCRNKPYQDKAMQRLRHSRDEFVNVIKTLEEDSRCQMLRIDSFLMLPMQRITRLPLLVNAVIQRTQSTKEKSLCEESLKSLTDLVLACNDAARESQDAEETSSILEKLEYPRGTRSPVTLGQFVMKGDFMKNPFEQGKGNQTNWTFRKSKRTYFWLLLFSNQLLITKKKTNGKFEVLDQSPPEEVHIKPLPNIEGVANDFQNFFMLHFNKKETVYFLASRTNSEVERWKAKLDSLKSNKVLQVEAIFPYESQRQDEMSFNAGDLIKVSQTQPDGWYYGTKVNDGQSGWFPGNYCCEV